MKGKNYAKEGNKRALMYIISAVVVAILALGSVITIVAVSNNKKVPLVDELEKDNEVVELPTDEVIVVEEPSEEVASVIRFVNPVESAEVSNTYGFFHNQTLNWYYLHTGVDFACDAGTEIKAVYAGTIESIITDDVLLSNQITIDHGDGLKTVYTYINPLSTIKVGDKVVEGQAIGFVAEATGDEYQAGSHLHFEVVQGGKMIDPEIYLEIAEK